MSTPSITRTDILNPRLESDTPALAEKFQNADPFPHVAIPDFFASEFAQRLLDDFPSFDERYAKGEMGEVGRKAARKDVREISDTYREVDAFIQTPEFLNFMSAITGIPDLMYDLDYFGGGTHENLHGQNLYTHVDFNYHPKGWHRRLNLIVYLSPEWEEEWGGSLELRSNPWDPSTDHGRSVPPLFNQAVLFETSEHSWHGFAAVDLPEDKRHLSRKSFAIYMYTKDRPADQAAAAHSTVYVPPGMPKDIQPGTTLSEEQHQLLNKRFNEYRSMLKLQYDRQLRLSEEFRAGYRLDLQGYAVQTRAPAGRWTDGWVSSEFSMEFRASSPVRGLLLEVSVPPGLESGQVLEIEAGDWSGTKELRPGKSDTLDLPITAEAGETVEVAIHAAATMQPGPQDQRGLAYRIDSAALVH